MTRTKMEMAALGLVENPDPDPLLPSSTMLNKPGSRQEGEEGESGSEAGRPQRSYGRAVKRELRRKASASALAMVTATAFFLGSLQTHGLVPSVLLRGRGLECSRIHATRLTCSSTQGGGAVGDDNSPPRKPPKTLSIVKNGIDTPQFSDPTDIPPFLMEALKLNDFPEMDSGLRAAWDLGGDTTKFIFLNNYTDFTESAHETARDFPTSFYGMAMNGQGYELETEINYVGYPADDERCWIATQVMRTVSSDGRLRRWQWEMRKRRRPPMINTWYVENIGSSDKDGQFDTDLLAPLPEFD